MPLKNAGQDVLVPSAVAPNHRSSTVSNKTKLKALSGDIMWRAIIISIVLGMFDTTITQSADPRAEFLTLYAPHAIALRDSYTNIECKCVDSSFGPDSKKRSEYEVKYKYNFGNIVQNAYSSRHYPTGGTPFVSPGETAVVNRRYTATMSQPPNGNGRVMTAFTSFGAEAPARPNILCVPFASPLSGRSYFDMVSDPKIPVFEFREVQWDGAPARELILEFTRANDATGKPILLRCGFLFRSERRWICCGHRVYSGPNKDITEVEEHYRYAADGDYPFLIETDKWIMQNGRPPLYYFSRGIITESVRAPRPYADADFTLTAFGMPEPKELPEPPPTSVPLPTEADLLAPPPVVRSQYHWWHLAIVMGLIGALAVLLVRRRRRPASTPVVQP